MMEQDASPGLYIHVPFCSAICPYCDFAVVKSSERQQRSFAELIAGEAARVARSGRWPADAAGFGTIYFGGGTPSLLALDELRRILDAVAENFAVDSEVWIQLEANPEDVNEASLAGWRALGVRSLSLGVQSFDAAELAFLGRRHSPEAAVRAVEMAMGAGFESVSLDLIYALPGQTAAAWRRNLEVAVRLAPGHLSCYELTVHERTQFGKLRRRGALIEEGEERRGELFEFTHRFLRDAGWPGYEVSNFARAPAQRSRHNRKYWHHTPYLGLGPSAHSFDGKDRRWWNEARLGGYRRRVAAGQVAVASEERLSRAELRLEAVMLALRTVEGIDRASFERRFGVDPSTTRVARRYLDEGLLLLDAGRLAPTLAGWAVADTVALELDIELGE